MIIMTTMGIALVEQDPEEQDGFIIRSPDRKVLESVAQTIELTDTEEGCTYALEHDALYLSKGTAALWMTHELLNYGDYTDFGAALLELNQTSLAMIYDKLRIEMGPL